MSNCQTHHILYSFRRCPYVIGSRMSMYVAGLQAKMVDIPKLRDKPPEMLALSPKGTVPVLHLKDGSVIDESLELMIWALKQADQHYMDFSDEDMDLLVIPTRQNQWFKMALDRYKYPNRYPDEDCSNARETAHKFLSILNERLSMQKQLCGDHATLCDLAVFPFIRQLANIDREWFDNLSLKPLQQWLLAYIESDVFADIFKAKNKIWLIEAQG